TAVQHTLDQDLELAAGILLPEQASRDYPGVVKHHQVARPQVIQQVGKAAMCKLAGLTVKHQQSTGPPLCQGVAGYQGIRQLKGKIRDVHTSHSGVRKRSQSLSERR